MAWVKSEYAGELAVLSAWLSMVLPWNVAYNTSVPTDPIESEMLIVRFSIFEIQFRFPAIVDFTNQQGETTTSSAGPLMDQLFPGINVVLDIYLATPVGAIRTYDGFMLLGSVAWLIGAGALLVSFAVSVAFYRDEEGFVERSDVDPVRLIGGLLGVATVATGAATALYFLERDFGGVPIPVGVLIMGALAVTLLGIDRK